MRTLALLALLAALLTGCGSSGDGGGGNGSQACVTKLQGDRVCGKAALSYCKLLQLQDQLDERRQAACDNVRDQLTGE